MRLFSLEYYRQIIRADETNFVNAKKNAKFKIKYQLGPFIFNSREAGREADLILQSMKFQRSFVWRYDPLEFITKKRQKVKLGPFIHHLIPEIEAYANQSEWVEGTLIDQESTRIDIENALINLEKQLDEGSFLQVPEKSEGPNQSNMPDQSDIPEKSDRLETTMSTPPVVQTPLNEEKCLKRNREGATTSARATAQAYAETSQDKRQRVNPVSKQQYTEETA